MKAAHAALLLALALALPGLGCHGNGGSVLPVGAAFDASGTQPVANLVRLSGQASGDTVLLDVVIDGPTASTDLYSFDLVLRVADPTLVEYVAGSATLGPALTLGGGQTGVALAAQNGAILTVGATKLGGGAGNGLAAGEQTILRLTLRVLRRGLTTIAIAGAPDFSPAALDSNGAVVPSVQFDLADASISGT